MKLAFFKSFDKKTLTPPAPTQPRFQQKKFSSEIKSLALTLFFLITIRSSIADHYLIPSGSMEPTIITGDHVLVNKTAYDIRLPLIGTSLFRTSEPQRGDVIVFQDPTERHPRLIKRLVGLPGDQLSIRDGWVYLNGQELEVSDANLPSPLIEQDRPNNLDRLFYETIPTSINPREPSRAHQVRLTQSQVRHLVRRDPEGSNPYPPLTLVVPAGHYFFMGDNRDRSADSREWGFATRDQILGKAKRVITLTKGRFWAEL